MSYPDINPGFSESVRQTRDSLSVDFHKGYYRKYWSLKQETITVRCLSTEVEQTNTGKFRNEVRAFLYTMEEDFTTLISEVESEYYGKKDALLHKLERNEPLTEIEAKDLNLECKLSIRVRAYEKEFFYLKCLSIQQKPQLVLRALAMLARSRDLDEVITTPEFLFSLLRVGELPRPVFCRDVGWREKK